MYSASIDQKKKANQKVKSTLGAELTQYMQTLLNLVQLLKHQIQNNDISICSSAKPQSIYYWYFPILIEYRLGQSNFFVIS